MTTFELNAQCNKTVKELEALSLMDTTKFKAYAMKNGIEFTNRTEDFIEYHCSNEKSTKFIIKFTDPKWFQYEFVEKEWYDSYFTQLREREYNIVQEDYGQRFASKAFYFQIVATDEGFYMVRIDKK